MCCDIKNYILFSEKSKYFFGLKTIQTWMDRNFFLRKKCFDYKWFDGGEVNLKHTDGPNDENNNSGEISIVNTEDRVYKCNDWSIALVLSTNYFLKKHKRLKTAELNEDDSFMSASTHYQFT